MKLPSIKRLGLAVAAALALSAPLANAADLGGFTDTGVDSNGNSLTDAQCALDSFCASSRGGVSDVMTVYAPDHSVFDRIFAFGNEEGFANFYFFTSVGVDSSQNGNYTQIVDNNGLVGDAFGIGNIGRLALGFESDSEGTIFGSPNPLLAAFPEIPGGNPNHWILEPGSNTLSIEYIATQYLDLGLLAQGFTVTFQSDVPEPASLALFGIGAAAAFSRRKRATA